MHLIIEEMHNFRIYCYENYICRKTVNYLLKIDILETQIIWVLFCAISVGLGVHMVPGLAVTGPVWPV